METDQKGIQDQILAKLGPYLKRISELETSLQDKENEAIILRLAAQQLRKEKELLEGGKKGTGRPTRGGRTRRGRGGKK